MRRPCTCWVASEVIFMTPHVKYLVQRTNLPIYRIPSIAALNYQWLWLNKRTNIEKVYTCTWWPKHIKHQEKHTNVLVNLHDLLSSRCHHQWWRQATLGGKNNTLGSLDGNGSASKLKARGSATLQVHTRLRQHTYKLSYTQVIVDVHVHRPWEDHHRFFCFLFLL